MEVFHLARFARAFFFCARLCAINPAAKLPRNSGENKKGEPVDEFAFVFMRGLVRVVMLAAMSMQAVMHALLDAAVRAGFYLYFNASRAALTAASTCSGAVPPG